MIAVDVRRMVEEIASNFPVLVKIEEDCKALADNGLRNVIENIFQNVIQHGKTSKIDVNIRKYGNRCKIRTADYGVGTPDEIKDKIFEYGFKYGESAGSGIGLYIVRMLVKRYDNRVRVEDNEKGGSVFIIKLTVAE